MPRRPRNPTVTIRDRRDSGRGWQATVRYPDPDLPKAWKQRAKTFERKVEAQAWAEQVIAEYRAAGEYRQPSEQTFETYAKNWMDTIARLSVRPSTLESHRYMMKHAIRAFGQKPLADLRPADVQGLYASMRAGGKSTATVRYVHSVLRKALQHAVETGLIHSNPALKTQPPRLDRKEIVPPTLDQARELLQSVENDRLRGLWYFIAMTGCRRGEALALRWEDINFDERTAAIRRTLTGAGSRRRIQQPKTRRSIRTVALSSILVEALRRHQETEQLLRRAARDQWMETGFVFTTRQGKLLEPAWVRKRFKTLVAEAGLPPTTRIHDLRHALATIWIAHGVPLQVVSARLGHASVAITLGIYAHVIPGQQAAAAEQMDTLLTSATISPLRDGDSE